MVYTIDHSITTLIHQISQLKLIVPDYLGYIWYLAIILFLTFISKKIIDAIYYNQSHSLEIMQDKFIKMAFLGSAKAQQESVNLRLRGHLFETH